MEGVLRRVLVILEEFNPQELSLNVWAFAKLEVNDAAVLKGWGGGRWRCWGHAKRFLFRRLLSLSTLGGMMTVFLLYLGVGYV